MNDDVLRLLRIVNGYKQQDIAEVLGITQNTYSRLEKNPNSIIAGNARKLAAFYKISVEDLLSDKIPVVTSGETPKNNEQTLQISEVASLIEQRDFLRRQNEELLKLLEEKKSAYRNIKKQKA